MTRSHSQTATAALAIALACSCIITAPANAGTTRDHRGQARTYAPPQLGCGAFKQCSKLGVIVRDHRTGAQQGGK